TLQGNTLEACLVKNEFKIEKRHDRVPYETTSSNIYMAAAGSTTLEFTEFNPRSYHIISSYSVTNAQLLSAIANFRSALSPLFNLLPSSWVSEIMGQEIGERTEIDSP